MRVRGVDAREEQVRIARQARTVLAGVVLWRRPENGVALGWVGEGERGGGFVPLALFVLAEGRCAERFEAWWYCALAGDPTPTTSLPIASSCMASMQAGNPYLAVERCVHGIFSLSYACIEIFDVLKLIFCNTWYYIKI